MRWMTLAPAGVGATTMLAWSLLCCIASCAPGRFDAGGLCAAEAEAICRFQFRCCNASERTRILARDGAPYDDEDSCAEEYTRDLCAAEDRVVDSVAAGRAAWGRVRAEACYGPLFAALEACDTAKVFSFTETSATCAAIIRGEVREGGACFEDYECASAGSTCRARSSGDPTRPIITAEGACRSPAGEGDPCATAACAADLYCDAVSLACARIKAEGEPCSSAEECASGQCASTSGERVCDPWRANGQSCHSDRECQSGDCDEASSTCRGGGPGPMPTYDLCTGKMD